MYLSKGFRFFFLLINVKVSVGNGIKNNKLTTNKNSFSSLSDEYNNFLQNMDILNKIIKKSQKSIIQEIIMHCPK